MKLCGWKRVLERTVGEGEEVLAASEAATMEDMS
jgi:hypothetical protein